MPAWITRTDFENVVQVSKHCDYEVLQNYILERQNLDMLKLLGNCFYLDVDKNLTNTDYNILLNGGEFQIECGDETKTLIHFGLKRVLIHYSYAAYVYSKSFVDTPFSVVIKQSQDSVPATPEQLKDLHNQHRRMAYSYWEMTLDYLCANKDNFTEMDDSICQKSNYYDCDCNDCKCGKSNCKKCKGGNTDGTRRSRIKIISK